DQRRYDRQIRNRIRMNSMTHTRPHSSVCSSPEDCRNRPPRSWFVIRHRCHFVKQRLCLATQTTVELPRAKEPLPQSRPNDLSALQRLMTSGAVGGVVCGAGG